MADNFNTSTNQHFNTPKEIGRKIWYHNGRSWVLQVFLVEQIMRPGVTPSYEPNPTERIYRRRETRRGSFDVFFCPSLSFFCRRFCLSVLKFHTDLQIAAQWTF